MTAKNVLYAAVGAPVVAARKVVEAVSELRSTLNKEADTLGKTTNKRVAVWADEGEKLVSRITDAKMVDELTSKVDFDQVSTQVSKLRDQLEDMLATWKASFRPEKFPTVTAQASPEGVKIEAKTSVAAKPARRRPAGPKTTAAKAAATNAVTRKAPARAGKAPARASVTATVTTKATSAKKAAAKEAPGKKAPAQKAPAQKASAKKASAQNASAKKASARKASSSTTNGRAKSSVRKAVAVG